MITMSIYNRTHTRRPRGQAVVEYTIIGAIIAVGVIVAGVALLPTIRDRIVEFRNCGIDQIMGKTNPC